MHLLCSRFRVQELIFRQFLDKQPNSWISYSRGSGGTSPCHNTPAFLGVKSSWNAICQWQFHWIYQTLHLSSLLFFCSEIDGVNISLVLCREMCLHEEAGIYSIWFENFLQSQVMSNSKKKSYELQFMISITLPTSPWARNFFPGQRQIPFSCLALLVVC